MARRRGAPSINTLSPPETAAPSQTSPGFLSFPRSTSPSTGFTQFLSKPTKWFNRSSSSGSVSGRTSTSSTEPRSSTSSGGRKPKISHPTDPRPILDKFQTAEPASLSNTNHVASRSVLDLSLGRTAAGFDLPQDGHTTRTPSSPSHPAYSSKGLGDLRNISRKPWSKSADDLGQLSQTSSPAITPIDATFQEKIEQYRTNRADSVGSSTGPSSAASPGSASKNYPFPSLPTRDNGTSSPPPKPNISPVSTSPVNSATPPLTPASAGHVHGRSHSFTPKLPSKLSAPKLGLAPPSPKRKGSASSDVDATKDKMNLYEREKNVSGGSLGHGPSPRPTFPFNIGGSSKPSVPSNAEAGTNIDRSTPSPGLLAPPTIIEPSGDDDARSEKRTSQVIFHSGFINRLADFSPQAMNSRATQAYMAGAGGSMLAKGWKPFKLVLKGSKLYFYKTPGDRTNAIKDLFPTQLVVILEDGLPEVDDDANGSDAEETFGRGRMRERDRKRAYWGRSTHPELVWEEAIIKSGSFDALIHEAVFSTTFFDDCQATLRYHPHWQDFSSSVLASLPSTNRTQFETEFTRCCTLLIDGADDDHKDEERSRVVWLASQYLAYFGSPVDATSWEGWRNKAIPNTPLDLVTPQGSIPQSASTQAMYAPSPVLGSSPPVNGVEFSPDLGTFSPRPNQTDRMISLVDALSDPGLNSLVQSRPKKAWQVALSRTGFTRDLLLNLDVQLVARSLCVFNQKALQKLPLSITVDACADAHPEENTGEGATSPNTPAPHNPTLKHFFGNDDHIHWLTKVVLLQILISDTPGRPSVSISSVTSPGEERPPNSNRSHSRSEVISVWTRIAECCRRTGDECSWRAIAAALCSRPIARLDKVWKRVDLDAIRAVQSWIYPNELGEVAGTPEPKTVPWVGDRITQFKQALDAARNDSNEYNVLSLANAKQTFEGLRTDLSLCSRKAIPIGEDSNEVDSLVEHWETQTDTTVAGGLVAKFTRADQFLPLSLAAEPRRKGAFEPYFWIRAQTPALFHPLAPLLFLEPLPSLSFVNRALLPRGRLDSTAGMSQADVQYARELKTVYTVDKRPQPDKMSALDMGGTTIVLYEGELTLLVQPGSSDPPPQPTPRDVSRPPSTDAPLANSSNERGCSRAPSMRVKAGANANNSALERKASQLRRNSLPSLTRKPSFITQDVGSDRPLRVVVQAGTLDRLVDILVEGLHGISVSVADDNGEMSLNAEKTRELKVDMDEYNAIWWSTFRSFVTPLVFFELLRKRFISAQPKVQGQSPASDLASMIRAKKEVLETISNWFSHGGGAQDALDDSQLYTALISFLSQPAEFPVGPDYPMPHAVMVLDSFRKSMLATVLAQTRRPTTKQIASGNPATRPPSMRNFGSEPPDFDQTDPETLVNNLEGMASAAFRNVVQEDLFVTADILEVQTADRTGWFPVREPSSISDEVEIQAIHSFLHEVEPSPMISELGQETIYRLLPPAVRGCIRAFGILRKWLVSKLTAPKIGLRMRHLRMEILLRAIEVCRIRNAVVGELPAFERPCVRSFVEAVLTSAALSVESRTFHRAWQVVATARGTSCDTLSAVLSKPVITSVTTKETLTADMGWLIEKVLEVITMPDALVSPPTEALSLINFDKRRSLHGLITSAVPVTLPSRNQQRLDISRIDFERLNNIERSLEAVHFDLRAIREEAYRESVQAGPPQTKRQPRPFQTIVTAQQEKNKRDKALRDRLSREKRLEQQRQDRREEYLNKAMNPRRPQPPPTTKQHRNKKSMSSAFLHFMRPISSAFTSDTPSSNTVKRTPAELDFAPAGKPTLVLNVVDARVSQFINNERSFTFQIDTEDGGHYLLQAMDKMDMKKWMETVEKVSKSAAKRRLTYMGDASKLQASDHLVATGSQSRDPRAVFGVELEYLLGREAGGKDPQPGAVPVVIDRLISYVEAKGLTDIGIYRVAGAHSEINNLKDALNKGEWPIDRYTDVNAVCDLIKAWFRVLPGGMFPGSNYAEVLAAASNDAVDLNIRVSNIRRAIHSLPDTHFPLLKRLMEHLDKVTDYEEHNQMTADSLSTVFCPNLLRSSNNDIGFFFANMSAAHRAIKLLITHFHTIFDDVEPEQEAESDPDEEEYEPEHLDEPIPEEDEEDILSASQDMSDVVEDEVDRIDNEDETSRFVVNSNYDDDVPHAT